MSTRSTPIRGTGPISRPPLGTVIGIDPRTVLIIGQELDVAHRQPDVGNVVLHRVDHTLFMIDTGVTAAFRQSLLDAIDHVGPWSRLVVLTTHGHLDHVGNNDLADQLATERGISAEHYLPAADIDQMIDPRRYWCASFRRIRSAVPLPGPPLLVADELVSWFQPYQPFATVTRSYEQLAITRVRIGSYAAPGWSFADGAVQVVRSQGHCAGHVVVYLRDAALIHLGDESNGPVPVMIDSDPVKLSATFAAVTSMLDGDAVQIVTDGHGSAPCASQQFARRIADYQEQEIQLHNQAIELVNGQRAVDLADLVAGWRDIRHGLDIGGPNSNDVFTGMHAVRFLDTLGYIQKGRQWHRLPFRTRPASRTLMNVRRVAQGFVP